MRYWLLVGKKTSGPFEPEELVKTKGFSPESLICPENKPAENRRSWKSARKFKDVSALFDSSQTRLVFSPPLLKEIFSSAAEPAMVPAQTALPAEKAQGRAPARKKQPRRSGFAAAAVVVAAAALWQLNRGPRVDTTSAGRRPASSLGEELSDSKALPIQTLLERVALPARGKNIKEEMGPKARWRVRRLFTGVYWVEIKSQAFHPLTGRRYVCRFLYDPAAATVQGANALGEFLLGTKQPVALP